MNNKSSHIITNNHTRITKKYFNQIILPMFGDMAKSIKPIVKIYNIAGKIIFFNFYSKKLFDKMHQALKHNEENLVHTPDLTINIWDSASTNTDIISPWDNTLEYMYLEEKDSRMFNYDSFLGVYLNGEETLNLYDEANKKAYFWINDAEDLPFWISAAPLRIILNWFLSKYNIHFIHGALVGMNGKSVLIAAKGGSGKSTTALSCLVSGMDYMGDDFTIIEAGDKIIAHSLFSSIKVFPQTLETFPELREKIWNKNDLKKDEGKALIFLSELFHNQMVKKSFLNAIFIPVIKNTKETRIIPATKIDTMIAMIPSTIFQLFLTESNKITELKSIIEHTPCYSLELGSDPSEVAEAIKSFLSHEQ